MEKIIETPFGAHDSELQYWEYTIPEGYTAEIKDGKVVVKKNESEDEKIRKALIQFLTNIKEISESGRTSWAVRKEDAEMCNGFLAYIEKQKEQKSDIEICPRRCEERSGKGRNDIC